MPAGFWKKKSDDEDWQTLAMLMNKGITLQDAIPLAFARPQPLLEHLRMGGQLLEIIPQQGFYDYRNKYQGTTREVCPAELDPEVTAELGRLALLGFDALRLKNYARLDFMLDRQGKLWCLEANSLPGMTPQCLLPQEAAAVGMSYAELCETILHLGF